MVLGIGIVDVKTKEKNIHFKSYSVWRGIIARCYSERHQIKNPTYKGCSVSSDWLIYSNFKKFYDTNYKEGYHLDKDILIRGNKIYSEKTCRFVPQYINTFLTDSGAIRGKYKIGVYFEKDRGTFRAQCNVYSEGKNRNRISKKLGRFNSEEEAFQAYKTFKEQHIKEVAQQAFNNKEIDIDIFNALQNWTIE